MEKILHEIQYIEDYLLGKLDDAEKVKFEKRLKTDADFAKKVKHQALIMKRVRQIAIKKSISRAHNNYLRKQRFSFCNIVKNPKNAFLTFLGILLIGFLVWEAETENRSKRQNPMEETEQVESVEEIQKNSTDTLKINDSISKDTKEETDSIIFYKNKSQ